MAAQGQPQYPSFQGLQQQGIARPPNPGIGGVMPGATQPGQPQQPKPGQPGPLQQQMMHALGGGAAGGLLGSANNYGHPNDPTPYKGPGPQIDQQARPGGGSAPRPAQTPPYQQAQNQPQQNGPLPQMPNLQQMWQQQISGAQQGHFGGGPQSNFSPSGYQGPGNLHAYQQSNYAAPQVQQQGQFNAPQAGQQVDQRTGQAVMEALGNPSRYGSNEARNTYDIFNRQLTQQGNADKQMIDENMASRGIYASTTAGGRMGDLATNLGQQRADFATNLATDQARNYQTDRSSAISQALGYGGQQFGQGLQGFEANQGAGAQRFGQEQAAGQFGLAQNQQNFGQQLQQHGANQQEGLNQFNSGMDQAQFGLGQNNQNYNQGAATFGLNQGANQQAWGQRQQGIAGLQGYGQQGFNNQLQTAQFNADQQNTQTQQYLQMLGLV